MITLCFSLLLLLSCTAQVAEAQSYTVPSCGLYDYFILPNSAATFNSGDDSTFASFSTTSYSNIMNTFNNAIDYTIAVRLRLSLTASGYVYCIGQCDGTDMVSLLMRVDTNRIVVSHGNEGLLTGKTFIANKLELSTTNWNTEGSVNNFPSVNTVADLPNACFGSWIQVIVGMSWVEQNRHVFVNYYDQGVPTSIYMGSDKGDITGTFAMGTGAFSIGSTSSTTNGLSTVLTGGEIDDMMIWSRVFRGREFSRLLYGYSDTTWFKLVFFARIDEGTGAITDKSGASSISLTQTLSNGVNPWKYDISVNTTCLSPSMYVTHDWNGVSVGTATNL